MSVEPDTKVSLDLTTNGMLIPERIADPPTQRFYATSLFILLQALKFHDYIQLYGAPASAETTFAVKWIAIDATFLFLIPKLKIPWLSFGLAATFLQITIIGIFDIFLSARIPFSFSAIGATLLKLLYDRELSVLEHNVKVSDLIHNASRILGEHTINVLPESTAKINPSASCFCVSSGSEAAIPVRMNSTIPMLIQYSRIDPQTNDYSRHNITGRDLKNMLKHTEYQKSKVWHFSIPVSEPGLYKLERVRDTSRMDVRLYRAQALVVQCPSASLIIPERLRNDPDRCTRDLDELSLRVFGLPPLRVKYNRWIEGQERTSIIDSVKPPGYSSPLIIDHDDPALVASDRPVLRLDGVQDLLWAKARNVNVHLNSSLQQPGLWSYTIEEVEDACGNTVNYATSIAKEHKALVSQAQRPLAVLDVNDDTSIEAPNYQFRVHERPRISFRGCTPERPTMLLEGRDAKLFFDISAPDVGPFELELGRGESDSLVRTSELAQSPYKRLTLTSKMQSVTVNESGIYNIERFASKHCKGVVQMPSSCIVFTPPRPSLSVSFDPIQDKCAGSIGLLADLSFTGSPPFDIAWKASKDGKAVQHRKKIDRARHQLRFTPNEAGHFLYEFTGLDDANYKGIRLDKPAFKTEQTVYPLAGASFQSAELKKCCIGDTVTVPIKLVGSGPWDLVYEIILNGKRQRFEMNGLSDPHQVITTPELRAGGAYTITLVSVQDAKGCKTPLEEVDAKIEVRRDRPSASFYTIDDTRKVTIIEGSTIELPLRLLGDGPWQIGLKSPDKQEVIKIQDQNGFVKVRSPGAYKLYSVRDAFCPGQIDTKASDFEVQWFPKPRLVIPGSTANYTDHNKYIRAEICENDDDTFDVEVFGAPPFSVSYDRSYLGHKGIEEDKNSHEINAALPVISIKARSSPAGTHRYNFRGVSDARYNTAQIEAEDHVIIEQFVNSRPSAAFVEPEKTYNYCLEVDLVDQEADQIPITLKGQAPFAVRYRIKHGVTAVTEHLTDLDIPSHSWKLQVPKNMLTLGNHIVSIAEVRDAKGCSRHLTEKESAVHIAISERPSILPVSSRNEFCVGDRISHALQGTPPFTIEYDFNGARKRATVSGPLFSRIAEKPGNFSILTLSDFASKCQVTMNNLKNVIHDIPSVRVSEGKTIIESIHAGDQAEINFHLYGTPPFALTYTRSEVGKGRKSKVLETHSVSGIWDEKYIIHSSVAGTFKATELHDAHCRVSLQN